MSAKKSRELVTVEHPDTKGRARVPATALQQEGQKWRRVDDDTTPAPAKPKRRRTTKTSAAPKAPASKKTGTTGSPTSPKE